MEKYNLLSAVPLSARLIPPKPIGFDNHAHFLLSETNGKRQGGEVLKVREEIPKHPAKTGKSYCVQSDVQFLSDWRDEEIYIEKSAVSN